MVCRDEPKHCRSEDYDAQSDMEPRLCLTGFKTYMWGTLFEVFLRKDIHYESRLRTVVDAIGWLWKYTTVSYGLVAPISQHRFWVSCALFLCLEVLDEV